MRDYPEVRRVVNGLSSHIEPPLEEDWSDLEKLQWNAAVATLDTGLRILVHPMEADVMGRVRYSVQVENISASARPYFEAWSYISAVSTGGLAALRRYQIDRDSGFYVYNGTSVNRVGEFSQDDEWVQEAAERNPYHIYFYKEA